MDTNSDNAKVGIYTASLSSLLEDTQSHNHTLGQLRDASPPREMIYKNIYIYIYILSIQE